MNNILFPTEFSQHAPEMFKYALSIAKRHDATVMLMHAYGKPEPLVTAKTDEDRQNIVNQKLREFAQNHTPEAFEDVKLAFHPQLDYPSDAILNAARQQKAELVVIGMTGRNDPSDRFVGTNTLKVIERVGCPVLAIPSGCNWQRIQSITFTTNFEFRDLPALNFLIDSFEGAHIHVLHVMRQAEEQDNEKRKLEALQKAYNRHDHMSFQLTHGEIKKTIEGYIEEHGSDLLAMTTHKRNLATRILEGSYTRGIAKEIEVPLLVFKEV